MKERVLLVSTLALTCLTTLLALSPISRGLSKFGGEPWRMATDVFFNVSVPALTLGLIVLLVGLLIIKRRPVIGTVLMFCAPLLALVLGSVWISG